MLTKLDMWRNITNIFAGWLGSFIFTALSCGHIFRVVEAMPQAIHIPWPMEGDDLKGSWDAKGGFYKKGHKSEAVPLYLCHK